MRRVVAVVPCWNARQRLPAVLDALDGQVSHVVAVDNGSTDETASWLAEAPGSVTVVANRRNEGYPRAVNQGLSEARRLGAEAVMLVNDDAVVCPGAVIRLARALWAHPGAAAASAKMRYRSRPGVLNGTGGRFDPARGWAALRGAGEPDRGQYDDRRLCDYPSGAASLLRVAAIADVGPLDEAYFLYFEDTDWGLRARGRGWCTLYVPEAIVMHEGSAGTASDPARRRYYNVRNRLRLAALHCARRGRIRAWAETAALLAKQPPRWAHPCRRRDAEAVWWGVADHLAGRYGRSSRYG